MSTGDTPERDRPTLTVYLSLGANLGDRRAQLSAALDRLDAHAGIQVTAVSKLYETTPVNTGPDHAPYLNAAACIETTLPPPELLRFTQSVEYDGGRDRPEPTSKTHLPRPIDIDILCCSPCPTFESDPVLPHPRMHTRAFVLKPLADVAPTLIHPLSQRPIRDILVSLPDASDPKTVADRNWYRRDDA